KLFPARQECRRDGRGRSGSDPAAAALGRWAAWRGGKRRGRQRQRRLQRVDAGRLVVPQVGSAGDGHAGEGGLARNEDLLRRLMSELSNFHDVRFPLAVSFGVTGGPERRNEIVTLTSGREKRNARFS